MQKEELTLSKAALPYSQFPLMRGCLDHSENSPTQLTVPAVHSWLLYICSLSHVQLKKDEANP